MKYVVCKDFFHKWFVEYMNTFKSYIPLTYSELQTVKNDFDELLLVHKADWISDEFLKRAKLVRIMNTEQMCEKEREMFFVTEVERLSERVGYKVEVVDYSPTNISILEKHGFVCLLHLYETPEFEKNYLQYLLYTTEKTHDIGFVGALNPRRIHVIEKLKEAGYKVLVVKEYGDARDRSIAKCKVLLNIHYESYFTVFETIRCNRWLAAGMPVISESSIDVPESDLLSLYSYDDLCTVKPTFNNQLIVHRMLRSSYINSLFERYGLDNPEYLEIGVQYGITFKNVESSKKDGVDPGIYTDSPYVNYKMTSDKFFETNTKKYDFIFIDGLHTAYQVTKDIYNSINSLKDGGVIMLDDVFPHEEKEQVCLDLNGHGPMTGDVWKAVNHILDTLIDMSDEVLFTPQTERGNLVFKIKSGNTRNIVIDPSIPTNNPDGWNASPAGEWNLYTWSRDYESYKKRLFTFPSGM